MLYDIAITGGMAVSSTETFLCDIYILGGKIAEIKKYPTTKGGKSKTPERHRATRTIDASGKIVLPGIIDAHTHFHLKLGDGYSSDDFSNGSMAAALGGITTFIDYAGQNPGEPLVKGLGIRLADAEGKTYTDYSFHSQITGFNQLSDPKKEMKAALDAGMSTFKMFTAYAARGLMSRDDEFFKALEISRDIGGLVCVHCENGYLCDLLTERYAPGGGIMALPHSRPAFTEIESVGRVAQIASALDAPVYFVHLSAAGSAHAVQASREAGIKAMAETCPQYLCLNDKVYEDKDAWLYTCCPPFRSEENNQPLWDALDSGIIQNIASDSCSITREMKSKWGGDIRNMPMGIPGSQTLMPAVYTYGVKQGKIKLEQLVRSFCENPARIMGLENKGFIKEGYDADFAIIDPYRSENLDWRNIRHNADYSVWQGQEFYGFPDYTILRGNILVENGKFVAERPQGQYIKRVSPEII